MVMLRSLAALAVVLQGQAAAAYQLSAPMSQPALATRASVPAKLALPHQVARSSIAVMQVPETTDAAAAEAPAAGQGRVFLEEQPTYLTSADVEAQVQALLKKADPALSTNWRRAAFWEPGKATLLELVNVLGRYETSAQWYQRTEFLVVDAKEARQEDESNSLTLKRHEMALRMKCAERAAFFQNVPKLPFTNAKLAESVGLTVEDFETLPVTREACEVFYDALAESRSTLIPYNVIDERSRAMINADGTFNEVAFRIGHTKSTVLFIVGLFIFGKANFIWVLVGVKLLHDARPDLIPGPKELGLFKIWGVI